jgi:Protein of unknown function (DUF3040)
LHRGDPNGPDLLSGETIMPMSGDEWRQLRELEAQLAGHRRLAALVRRLESVGAGPRRISAFWGVAGAVIGFALVTVSVLAHSNVLVATGVVVLAAALVVAGAVSLVVEMTGHRRSAHSRRPES